MKRKRRNTTIPTGPAEILNGTYRRKRRRWHPGTRGCRASCRSGSRGRRGARRFRAAWRRRCRTSCGRARCSPSSSLPRASGPCASAPARPLFKDFPTESHSSWQWFPVVKASHPLVTDSSVSSIKPIVRVIDNIERNHSLVLLFEARVGKGSILVCMSDLDALTESDDSPIEAGQFYSAVLRYMRSEDFVPSQNCSSEQLLSLVRGNAAEREIGELGNISYE